MIFYINDNYIFKTKKKGKNINLIFKNNCIKNFNKNYIEVLNDNNIITPKCNFCNSDIDIEIEYTINENIINIYGVTFKNYYCYGKNESCSGRLFNPNSVDFVSKAYKLDRESALKKIKSRNKSPFYKENHKTIEEYSNYQKRNLDFFMNKFGDDGFNKYEIYLEKLKFGTSFDGFCKKNQNVDIDLLKNEWKIIQNKKDNSSLEYFISICDNESDAIELFKEKIKKTKNDLNSYISKYGIDEGTKKYNNKIEKYKNSMIEYYKSDRIKTTSYSQEASTFFDNLIIELNKINIFNNCNYKYKENEIGIYNEDSKTCYFYDFYIPEYNLIIEYNGLRYHPKTLNDDFKNIGDKDIKYFYNRDKMKMELAIKNGFKYLIVWEDDNEIEKIIKKIINICTH